MNFGRPISVEWHRTQKDFADGLCIPSRWRPKRRGVRRSDVMRQLADDTFEVFVECARTWVPDVGGGFLAGDRKLEHSPFTEEALAGVRSKWFSLFAGPQDATIRDDGHLFCLRALARWLLVFDDLHGKRLLKEKG